MSLSVKEKDKKKLDAKHSAMKEKEFEYQTAVKNTNHFQSKLYSELMPEIMRGFQKMEEKRIDMIKENLVAYLKALAKLPDQFTPSYAAMYNAINSINRDEDIQSFIQANITGEKIPAPATFKEYREDAEPVERGNKLIANIKAKGMQLLKREKANSNDEAVSGAVAGSAAAVSGSPGGTSASASAGASTGAGKLFGGKLEDMMAAQEESEPDLSVPKVLVVLTTDIIANQGPQTEGIFRVPADSSQIAQYRAKLEKEFADDVTQMSMAPNKDPNVSAGLLKLWLRELGEPLVPNEFYDDILAMVNRNAPFPVIEEFLKNNLPPIHVTVLLFLIRFLHKFAPFASISKMTEANIAMVFAPSILRCPSNNPATILTNTTLEKNFALLLIQNIKPVNSDDDSGGVDDTSLSLEKVRQSIGALDDVQL